MTKRMLIDATQPEETRVVVLDGERVDDFDYESSARQTLKGNIYLGKITRVEPSLQAAFVEYGGNRHGFLPFNDIHPDYYRIPIADREALIDDADDDGAEDAESDEAGNGTAAAETGDDAVHADGDEDGDEADPIETVGGAEDEVEDAPRPRPRMRRHYKIQEVIKRRQIILVQVTKEERGNKGAALTSYISLAGRYCVLMPNAVRGGGISRKITNVADRRRLKEVIDSLEVPEGMGVILRTAGMERSKPEIRRDYEFLLRVWDEIREKTLSSRAPALIYEEASLIKRAIRDTYSQDIAEILVEGESAFRGAREFMRALMPTHVDRVVKYDDPSAHLFPRYGVESQLDALHSHTVRLRSGGYIVINATEALVAIDVNSGRATRERHIEETAVKTNLEAADEIARQLRLRDLAGIVVIDFIDMEDRRNNSAVERRLKEALKTDRARIQMGRISQLGLLELSRQRLRPSLFETSMVVCPTCGGHGSIRSVESTALYVFRSIEEDALKRRHAEVTVQVPTPVALYILNHKRHALHDLERANALRILVECDDALVGPAFRIEQTGTLEPPIEVDYETVDEDEAAEASDMLPAAAIAEADPAPEAVANPVVEPVSERAEETEDGDGAAGGKRRRRGRRGGRRRGRRTEGEATEIAAEGAADDADDAAPEGTDQAEPAPEPAPLPAVAAAPEAEAAAEPQPVTQPEPERVATAAEPAPPVRTVDAVAEASADVPADRPKSRRPRRRKAETASEAAATAPESTATEPTAIEPTPAEPETPKPKATRTRRTAKPKADAATAAKPETEAKPKAARTRRPRRSPEAEAAGTSPSSGTTNGADMPAAPAAAGGPAAAETTTAPAPAETPAADQSATHQPRRRGWWQ
ncbi:MAG: Rne/Rng family ribonuclease, partial [Alphaproteobacteria bacterium]